MSRVPVVGSDVNTWGTVLNDFLGVAHNADGSIKNLFINVKDPIYGAKGDGITDDTAAITAANTAANAIGGGILYFPFGTYISGPQTIYSNVRYDLGGSTIKLKNGSNADLFSANIANINLSGASGTGSSTAVTAFVFRNGILDGNLANQSAGPSYPLRFYGYGYLLENLEVKNGYSGGILCDYFGAFPSNRTLEATWKNVRVHDGNGVGIEIGGPSDSRWESILSYVHNSHSFHIGPNASGLQAVLCHGWNSGQSDANSTTWLIEAAISCTNCEAEGSNQVQIVLLSNNLLWHGGRIFAGAHTGAGIQIGQTAGGTPYTNSTNQSGGVNTAYQPNGYILDTQFYLITNSSGALWFVNDGGGIIKATISASAGTNTVSTGSQSTRTTALIDAIGYTADGTNARSGFFTLRPGSNSFAFLLADPTNKAIFSVNTFAATPRVEIPNGAEVRMYSDAYSTVTFRIAGETISYGQSTSAAATATNGTITTSGVGIARVAPTGNITGVILQVGATSGQRVTVRNESAFTVTFDVAGTSHVADGVTSALPANCSRAFEWSGTLWYRFA